MCQTDYYKLLSTLSYNNFEFVPVFWSQVREMKVTLYLNLIIIILDYVWTVSCQGELHWTRLHWIYTQDISLLWLTTNNILSSSTEETGRNLPGILKQENSKSERKNEERVIVKERVAQTCNRECRAGRSDENQTFITFLSLGLTGCSLHIPNRVCDYSLPTFVFLPTRESFSWLCSTLIRHFSII